MPKADKVAVLGAGTMGSGIAQVALEAGFEVVLFDPAPTLETAVGRLRARTESRLERHGSATADIAAALARLTPTAALADIAEAAILVEAVPEDLQLKRRVMEEAQSHCGPRALLATNTSSLPVTSIAAAAPYSERVIGLHFFNPVPAMRLVEVVAGAASEPAAVDAGSDFVERLGKRPIVVRDVPGFVANRCARPFVLEAVKASEEGMASPAEIDRILERGGGFAMGPFRLVDLVGIDINFTVAKSLWEQAFLEPRWTPTVTQQRMIDAGRLGRKTGRGFYEYPAEERNVEARPGPAALEGSFAVLGDDPLAEELRAAADSAGLPDARVEDADLCIVTEPNGIVPTGHPLACGLCAGSSLATLGAPFRAGFHHLPPLADAQLIEVTFADAATDRDRRRVLGFFERLGRETATVGDGPGLILGRVVAQLVNEAWFATSQGVAEAADIDLAMELGMSYPFGPLAWGERIGLARVVEILDGLYAEYGEGRFRVAPALRRRRVSLNSSAPRHRDGIDRLGR